MFCSMYARAVSCLSVKVELFIVALARFAASSSVRLGIATPFGREEEGQEVKR